MKKRFIFFLVFLLSTFIKTGLSQDETPDRELMMDVQAGGYVSISPTAVKPYLSDDYAFTFWTTSTEFYFQSTGGCMVTPMAPVNLPHGKTVTGFGVSYTDNGDGIDDSMAFSLVRHDILTGTTDVLAKCTTDVTGFPSSPHRRTLKDVTIDHAYVNNYRYTYSLYVKFYQGSDKVKFHGAVISYN